MRVFLPYILIGLVPVLPVISRQSPLSDPKQEVPKEIKAYAKRHVDNESPMQTALIIDLFRDNAVGLTAKLIAAAYEQAYDVFHREKKALAEKQSPWRRIAPYGWPAALTVLLFFALRNWVSGLFQKTMDLIYGQLAGWRQFRGWALRRYRTSLLETHGEVKIRFRPGQPLRMKDVYVPLRAIGGTDNKEIDAQEALTRQRRLMVVGIPGSGKSMLLKHLASK